MRRLRAFLSKSMGTLRLLLSTTAQPTFLILSVSVLFNCWTASTPFLRGALLFGMGSGRSLNRTFLVRLMSLRDSSGAT